MCLSNNSPITNRVSIPGRLCRCRAARSRRRSTPSRSCLRAAPARACVDDLLEPRPEQIARYRRLMLLRPHRSLRCSHKSRLPFEEIFKTKLQAFGRSDPKTLRSQNHPAFKSILGQRLISCSRPTCGGLSAAKPTNFGSGGGHGALRLCPPYRIRRYDSGTTAICSLNAGRDEIAAYQRSMLANAGRSGMSCM